MKALSAFVALALLTTPAVAQGNAMTGFGLLDVCLRTDGHWIDFCHGYVQAVVDATDGDISCVPSGATRASITGVVVERMVSIAGLHDLNAFAVVHAVLQHTYPCAGRP